MEPHTPAPVTPNAPLFPRRKHPPMNPRTLADGCRSIARLRGFRSNFEGIGGVARGLLVASVPADRVATWE